MFFASLEVLVTWNDKISFKKIAEEIAFERNETKFLYFYLINKKSVTNIVDGFSFLFKEIENLKKQVTDLKGEIKSMSLNKPEIVAFKAQHVKNLPTNEELTLCKGLSYRYQ